MSKQTPRVRVKPVALLIALALFAIPNACSFAAGWWLGAP